jgi:IS5 family transposase
VVDRRQLYAQLVEATEQMVHQATTVVAALRQTTGALAGRLAAQAQELLPLVQRVIGQTRRRVLEGQKVPSEETVLRLHEPHTRAIPRHQGGALVAFGRQVIAGRAWRAGSSRGTRSWRIRRNTGRR